MRESKIGQIASRHFWAFAILMGLILPSCSSEPRSKNQVSSDPLPQLTMPDGFSVEVFAENVENARSMCFGNKGTLFVGTRTAGKVWAVRDEDQDFHADKIILLAENLEMPNGVAFRDGALYVAEVSRIIRFDNIENQLTNPPKPKVIYDQFPKETHHGWKYIAFGPDSLLYIPVGAPCNICNPIEDPRFASICRMKADGSDLEIYAKGIRNSVGFDWHPESKALWFTDNGRDWLGDDAPSDELNFAPEKAMHFGYPFCHAGDLLDPEFGDGHLCSEFTAPIQMLGPHVAALGMLFYTGDMFPESYRNQILICQHGSWNKSVPDGYRLSMVKLNGNKSESHTSFVEGWLQNGEPWGRPVALLQMEDGSVLVSDDFGNRIYRITYNKPE